MKKICVISNLHLSSNPRVWKEANTLAAAGYEVVIVTIWTSAEKREKDFHMIRQPNINYKAALNLIKEETPAIERFYLRARRRLSIELKKRLRIDTSWILDFAPLRMVHVALQEKADLYICHTEYGMQVGRELIRRKKKVAFDIEDWYSKDYLISSRPVELLERLEKFAIENAGYCTCPSEAMATALEQYSNHKKVHVIYNGFSMNENAGRIQLPHNGKRPSLIWFSQVVGPGRGLETLMASLEYLETVVEVHLLGNCSKEYEAQLKMKFPFTKGHQLFFHAPVAHANLLPELERHTIGLAIEDNFPANKDTTISNKILQYLQAGIKTLATATKGQLEVGKLFPESVVIVPVNDAIAWAKAINELLFNKPLDVKAQLEKFNAIFSWEAQEKKLLPLVDEAVNSMHSN